MEQFYVIYKHTSPSGKSYIGQTSNLRVRNNRHQQTAGCLAFSSAIKKYGWDNFIHEILSENLTLDEANTLEEQYIIDHNTLFPAGYNLLPGGNNRTHNDDTKLLLSSKLKGRAPSPGTLENLLKMAANRVGTPLPQSTIDKMKRPKTAEHIRKVAEANKGRVVSDETKAKISAANKGKPAHNKGKSPSSETRAKLSASLKGRLAHNKGKVTPQEVLDKRTKVCPHCNKSGHSNMLRFHFDNCKLKNLDCN